MDTPSLVLVPPTPLEAKHSPTSTDSSSTRTRSFAKSSIDQERSSSDTTIVTIYSMYEERGDSWSASPAASDEGKGFDAAADSRRDSFFLGTTSGHTSGGSGGSASGSFETAPQSPRSSRRTTVADTLHLGERAEPQPTESTRPRSQIAVSSWNKYVDLADDFSSKSHHPASHASPQLSSHSTTPEREPSDGHLRPARPPRSSPPSTHRKSQVAAIDVDSDDATPQSGQGASPPRPLPRIPSVHPPTPPVQHDSPPRPLLPLNSSPSASSLAPPDGEDPDSVHVRSTYAQLDVSGVKGDGVEEGVERTRARVTGNREAELRAAQSVGDGQEKKQDITAKEAELLASLDRYGFFVVPSHDRFVSLASSSLSRPLAHTSQVSTSGPATAPPLSSLPSPNQSAKEASRISKWGRMLEAGARDEGGNVEVWSVRPAKERKLRERTYKGIPDRWRSAAWALLVGRFARASLGDSGSLMRSLRSEYREALDKPSSYDIQIDLDVPRTINGHVLFRTRYGLGQRSLFHVLHCFSLRCSECGYCQGMGPLAATLLCYFEAEKVYAILVQLHNSYSMHTIFQPGFPGLLEAIYVQERITERMMPGVYAAFKKHLISTTSYATKWYITLFANTVPFQTQLRLWDAFIFEGRDVLVIMAVAIVWVLKDYLTSNHATFETVLSLLSSFFIPEDEDALMKWIDKAMADKKLRGDMQRWRTEWQGLVARGEDRDVLL